jgi:integral membrane protein
MAIATGVMALPLWFVDVPISLFANNPQLHDKVSWIGAVHGGLYMFYVLATLQLAVKAKWAPARAILFMLAGMVPFASFVAERRVVAQFLPKKSIHKGF